MVKAPHQIDTISGSLSQGEAARVRLEPMVDSANGLHGRLADGDATGGIVQATIDALMAPLEFPPLSAAMVPGDRIAIAVGEAVQRAPSIIRGVVDLLRQAGADLEAISIVTTSRVMSEYCRSGLEEDVAGRMQFVVHDPKDRENLCLLGATRHGDLLLNRVIFDADLVLPIACARLDDYGAFDGLYPQFCDVEAIERFRVPTGAMTEKHRNSLIRETSEAGSRIGAPIVMRIVPGAGDSIDGIVAGEPRAAGEQSAALCAERWAMEAERRASLVVATVTGGPESQTWQNVARAITAAERLVEEGGAIAICSNLDRAPGKSLGRLTGVDDLDRIERKILADHEEDSWPAWALARALQRGPVYFLSQLEEDIVEDLGLAPVADVAEIARLAGRHASYVVIDHSQHVVATVSGE